MAKQLHTNIVFTRKWMKLQEVKKKKKKKKMAKHLYTNIIFYRPWLKPQKVKQKWPYIFFIHNDWNSKNSNKNGLATMHRYCITAMSESPRSLTKKVLTKYTQILYLPVMIEAVQKQTKIAKQLYTNIIVYRLWLKLQEVKRKWRNNVHTQLVRTRSLVPRKFFG